MQIYYNFIKSIDLNNLEEIAKKYEIYENDKYVVEYCLNILNQKDVKYNDNLLNKLNKNRYSLFNKTKLSIKKYHHQVFLSQYGNYNKTSSYFLWNLIKIIENIDSIQTFMDEDKRLIGQSKQLEDQIKKLINMTFYNILYQNYKKLYEYCEYSLKNSLRNMNLKEFSKLYEQDKFFPYCLKEIDIVLNRYDFIKAYIDKYVITEKVLFFEKKIYWDHIFEEFSSKSILINNTTEASGKYLIKVGNTEKEYELIAGY
jgi:hypothetical protein